MTPSMVGEDGSNDQTHEPSTVSACVTTKLEILRHRADFLRAASARRQAAQGFLLQARARGDGSDAIRVGFTCSKKLGNAVARNRAKRRLREVARALLPTHARAGWDYVLVGRPKVTADRVFALLLEDLANALVRIHDRGQDSRPYTKGPQK